MEKKFLAIQVYPWEPLQYLSLETSENIQPKEWIILRSESNNFEAGLVSEVLKEFPNDVDPATQVYSLERTAKLEDLQKIKENNKKKNSALKDCKQCVKKYGLPMKLVDCYFSFDGSKLTFTFTAESRVDFRELVKDLTKNFQRLIRLQQIGSRDETKILGQLGPCGREICCRSFLGELGNITTDLARVQNIEQRGSDRLSGVCGRLKCCLEYEAEGYETIGKNMPVAGDSYKDKKGQKGRVISSNIIKHEINVRLEDGTIITKKFTCEQVGCSGCKYKA